MEAVESSGPAEQPNPVPSGVPPASGEIEATLDHLARLCVRLESAEQRFKQLTDECEGVLQGLVAVDRKHSSAVANLNERLGEWCNLEGKLLQESARRIEQFERGVGHEWMVIRQMHEEPIAELKDQAAQLRLTCLEAARLARFRLDSAEQAYSAYAADLERRMAEWSQELLKAARKPAEPWPLEGVAQLHQELRAGGQASLPSAADAARRDAPVAPLASRGERASTAAGDAARRQPARSAWIGRPLVVATAALLVTVSLGVYAWRAGGASEARPRLAQQATPASPSRPVVRGDANEAATEDRLSVTQREAERVGAIVDILAAPDLRRYALAGVASSPSGQPYGQVLWSRSRGLAASASRLAPLADGKVYRVWIVPDGPPVPAGVLAPDSAGRASLVVGGPLKLPLPVTIRVTIEDRGQTSSPRGPVYLVRVPTA